MEASEHGRHAITHYRFVEGYGQNPIAAVGTPLISQIECELETGRTHQIRVHMAHIGCPLLGDPLYGKQRAFNTSKDPAMIAVNTAIAAFKRQALHAAELGFIHPSTKEEMMFRVDFSPDITALKMVLDGLN